MIIARRHLWVVGSLESHYEGQCVARSSSLVVRGCTMSVNSGHASMHRPTTSTASSVPVGWNKVDGKKGERWILK